MTQKNHVFSLIQKLPLVFLLVVIVWNWYVVIGELCIADLIVENSNIALSVSYICIFALLMTVSIISLLLTIFTSPGNPPSQQQQQQCADNSSTDQFAVVESNSMRCPYCSNIKPERCHHCSMCKRCILRMDHHCPWVNNCIGFFNYKFFYLFLFYSSVTLAFIIGITISRLAMLTTISSRIGIVYVVNLAMDSLFFISAFGLFLYHSHLILTNSTTIESTEYGKERRKIVLMSQGYENELVRSGVNVYNVGKINNVKQVLGDNAWFWFLPVKSTISGDGMTFPKKSSVQAV